MHYGKKARRTRGAGPRTGTSENYGDTLSEKRRTRTTTVVRVEWGGVGVGWVEVVRDCGGGR